MKKALSLTLAIVLVFALCCMGVSADNTVYVSVSVGGTLVLAAAPVSVPDGATVHDVLVKAHQQYYSGGESGFVAGIDATWNMYMISQFWGTAGTPYVVRNDAVLGYGSNPADAISADVCVVSNGDNICVCDMAGFSVVPTVNGDTATLNCQVWSMDFSTFAYTAAPMADAPVYDANGNSLGTIDASGNIVVPAYGIVNVAGVAGIYLGEAPAAPVEETPVEETPAEEAPAGEAPAEEAPAEVTTAPVVTAAPQTGDSFPVLYLVCALAFGFAAVMLLVKARKRA